MTGPQVEEGSAVEPAPEPDASVAAPDEPPPVALPLGARAVVSKSFDLALKTSRQLRPASIYIGVQLMAIAAPLAIMAILLIVRMPEIVDQVASPPATPQEMSEADAGLFALIFVALILGSLGFVAISVDAQIIGLGLLAGQLVGRPLELREAVVLARRTFWAVIRASILVGIPLTIAGLIANEIVAPILGRDTEGTSLALTAIGGLLALPVTYVVTGVILGEVGAVESIRRSFRLARARWRLTVVAGLFSFAASTIQIFGLGAGADVLFRIWTVLGLGFESGALTTFATISLILLGIVALGSLIFTVYALVVAPQVVAFVTLTGYTGGLDRAREQARRMSEGVSRPVPPVAPEGEPRPTWGPSPEGPGRFRWVSLPMLVAIGLGILTSFAAIANVVGRG